MEVVFVDLGHQGKAVVLKESKRGSKVYAIDAHERNLSARLVRADEKLRALVLKRLQRD